MAYILSGFIFIILVVFCKAVVKRIPSGTNISKIMPHSELLPALIEPNLTLQPFLVLCWKAPGIAVFLYRSTIGSFHLQICGFADML
jgi:hypothetical protein